MINIGLHAKAMHGTSRIEGNEGKFEDAIAISYIDKDLSIDKIERIETKCIENEEEMNNIRKHIKNIEDNPINIQQHQNNNDNNEINNNMAIRRRESEERQRIRDIRMIERVENNLQIQNRVNNEEIERNRNENNNNNNELINNNLENNLQIQNQQNNEEIERDENNNNEIINNNLENNQENYDDLLIKARKWLNKCNKEELNGTKLPKCTNKIRKDLRKPINKVLKDKIIPLFKKIKIKDNYINSDQKWYIMEGIMAKMIYSIRKTIRNVLKIPINE